MKLLTSIFLFLIPLLTFPQKVKRIDIINADELTFVKTGQQDIKKLKGNVVFKHEGAMMYCDSSYFYGRQNTMEAFGNVKIEAGDSVVLYCDYLKYDGTKKIAYTRHNIRLYHKNSSLFTDSLDYYRTSGLAKYYTFGTIITGDDTLTSNYGYYLTRQRNFFPSGNVIVRNPKFVMHTDSLKFNTPSKTVYFLTYTEIKNDSGAIYCYSGYYNTVTNIAVFGNNTKITNAEKILLGDSIFYDKNKGTGIGYKSFTLTDTVQKTIIKGKYGELKELQNTAFVTDSAVFMQVDDNGDTLFLHSDTIFTMKDTTGKRIMAYYSVRFYKKDLQGKCDSLVYNFSDSVTFMFGLPVIWSDNYQLTAKKIDIESGSEGVKQVNLYDAAFIAEQIDTNKFNQIKGKNIFAFFDNGDIKKVEVRRNSQTVYYPEDDSSIIGLYNAESSDIDIYLDSSQVVKIVFLKNPEGTLYPPEQVPDDKDVLLGFMWIESLRPKDKKDIFINENKSKTEETNNDNG